MQVLFPELYIYSKKMKAAFVLKYRVKVHPELITVFNLYGSSGNIF